MFKVQNLILFFILVIGFTHIAESKNITIDLKSNVIVGASQISEYENLIKNKRIGVVANHTSVVFKDDYTYTHLIDSLLRLNFNPKPLKPL